MRKILKNIFNKRRSHTRNQLEDWLQSLEIDADTVADVSSDQWPAKNRVKSWKVKQYDFLNLPEYDLNQPWQSKELYDIVFCLEIFEYVYNPVQAVTNLYNILKNGGELYSSFHFIYPHHNTREIDYLRYTRWGVARLLKEAGFRSWVIVPRYLKTPELIRQVYSDEGMRGNRNNRGELHDEQGYLVKATK
ncbi:MAG TPA: class I SAM-dependent methyltransferase [Desulfobaccales bacterium]|nr:class I SAM-dependent methyltransferase [Desulfobaccales bacterium]